MQKAMMALFLLSGTAAAQERRIPPDGCCIPQNRQAFRTEYRAGQCLSNTLKRMSCPEVYARFDHSRAHINESSLNQFGRLADRSWANAPVPAPAPASAPAMAPPPPPSASVPISAPTRRDGEKPQPDPLPEPK